MIAKRIFQVTNVSNRKRVRGPSTGILLPVPIAVGGFLLSPGWTVDVSETMITNVVQAAKDKGILDIVHIIKPVNPNPVRLAVTKVAKPSVDVKKDIKVTAPVPTKLLVEVIDSPEEVAATVDEQVTEKEEKEEEEEECKEDTEEAQPAIVPLEEMTLEELLVVAESKGLKVSTRNIKKLINKIRDAG